MVNCTQPACHFSLRSSPVLSPGAYNFLARSSTLVFNIRDVPYVISVNTSYEACRVIARSNFEKNTSAIVDSGVEKRLNTSRVSAGIVVDASVVKIRWY